MRFMTSIKEVHAKIGQEPLYPQSYVTDNFLVVTKENNVFPLC